MAIKIIDDEDLPPNGTEVGWPIEEFKGEYATAMFRLQNEVGLGFKEARAVLMPQELKKALAREWSCTVENVYNLSRTGREKVKAFTGDDPKKNEELMPVLLCHIL